MRIVYLKICKIKMKIIEKGIFQLKFITFRFTLFAFSGKRNFLKSFENIFSTLVLRRNFCDLVLPSRGTGIAI